MPVDFLDARQRRLLLVALLRVGLAGRDIVALLLSAVEQADYLVEPMGLDAVRPSHAKRVANRYEEKNERDYENIGVDTRTETDAGAHAGDNCGMGRRHSASLPEHELEKLEKAVDLSGKQFDYGF